jgi:NAD(P) transhydrogenase
MDYDLLVIGQEREGIDRAIASARDGFRAAIVVANGSVPSLDTMRLAAFNISEGCEITIPAWRAEVARLIRCQRLTETAELESVGVDQIDGQARFVGPTTVEVWGNDERRAISSREIVLACGTRSRMPAYLRNDERFVASIETLLNLKDIPRTMIVVGAGDSGLNAAIMLASIGVEITVVDEHATLLELCGLFEARFDAVQSLDIAFRLDDEAIGTELRPNLQTAVRLNSGRKMAADAVLICVGREGNTTALNLDAVGVGVDERGRVWCDTDGHTWSDSISAVGGVIGFPRRSVVPKAHIHASVQQPPRKHRELVLNGL